MKTYHSLVNAVSAVPKACIAKELHQAYKERFLYSFIQLISYAEQALHERFRKILTKLEHLEINSIHFISPWFYSQYFKILEAMKKDDTLLVEQTIQGLADYDDWFMLERFVSFGLHEKWEQQVFMEELGTALD